MAPYGTIRTAFGYVTHAIVATAVVGSFALENAVTLYRIGRSVGIKSIPTPAVIYQHHVFLLNGLVAIVLGCCMASLFARKAALWVWVPTTIVLLYRLVTFPTSVFSSRVDAVLNRFFGSGCWIPTTAEELASGRATCIDQMFIVAPFIASVLYAVGAALQPRVWNALERVKPRYRRFLSTPTHGER